MITPTKLDRIALLLRQRLAERNLTGAGNTSGSKSIAKRSQEAPATASLENKIAERLGALSATNRRDEQTFRRTIVESILTDEFPDSLKNDSNFQLVVDQVTSALGEDEGFGAMLHALYVEATTQTP